MIENKKHHKPIVPPECDVDEFFEKIDFTHTAEELFEMSKHFKHHLLKKVVTEIDSGLLESALKGYAHYTSDKYPFLSCTILSNVKYSDSLHCATSYKQHHETLDIIKNRFRSLDENDVKGIVELLQGKGMRVNVSYHEDPCEHSHLSTVSFDIDFYQK